MQVKLVLILIVVQYSQKSVFSFEKGSNHQNHFSLGSLRLVKKSPCKISDSPLPPPPPYPATPPLTATWKTLMDLMYEFEPEQVSETDTCESDAKYFEEESYDENTVRTGCLN